MTSLHPTEPLRRFEHPGGHCQLVEGSAGAQIYLWMSYDSGLGVPQQDYVEAHMWANLAASQLTGSERERAVALRDSTAERMTTADLSEARRRAREWNAAH